MLTTVLTEGTDDVRGVPAGSVLSMLKTTVAISGAGISIGFSWGPMGRGYHSNGATMIPNAMSPLYAVIVVFRPGCRALAKVSYGQCSGRPSAIRPGNGPDIVSGLSVTEGGSVTHFIVARSSLLTLSV